MKPVVERGVGRKERGVVCMGVKDLNLSLQGGFESSG